MTENQTETKPEMPERAYFNAHPISGILEEGTDGTEYVRGDIHDTLKEIAARMHWKARRYTDGRQSYATSDFNDDTRALLRLGAELNATGDGTIWARDAAGRQFDGLSDEEAAMGGAPDWRHDGLERRVEITEAEVARLTGEIERLRAELDATRKAALRGMDAAKANASESLKLAEQARAESSPDALESERAANARLMDEVERLRAELDAALLNPDQVTQLRGALTWCGFATPESLEECCFRQKSLVLNLIRYVIGKKDRGEVVDGQAEPTAPQPDVNQVYIWSPKYSRGIVAWWRPDGKGYTDDLRDAGLYSLDDAKKITEPSNGDAVIVHRAVAEKLATRLIVDAGDGENNNVLSGLQSKPDHIADPGKVIQSEASKADPEPEWEVAREYVLSLYPQAFYYYMSRRILDAPDTAEILGYAVLMPGQKGAGVAEEAAWLDAALNIAKGRVLEQWPDAWCAKLYQFDIYQDRGATPNIIGTAPDELTAWIDAAKRAEGKS